MTRSDNADSRMSSIAAWMKHKMPRQVKTTTVIADGPLKKSIKAPEMLPMAKRATPGSASNRVLIYLVCLQLKLIICIHRKRNRRGPNPLNWQCNAIRVTMRCDDIHIYPPKQVLIWVLLPLLNIELHLASRFQLHRQ